MTRGAVLFAHNTDAVDYYAMACWTAARLERFCNLPTTVITDSNTIGTTAGRYAFHNVVQLSTHDTPTNYRSKNVVWRNRRRADVFYHSPYDETLVVDVDYLVNSAQLLSTFDYPSDFVHYGDANFLLKNRPVETFATTGHQISWATVMRYRNTTRCEAIFNVMTMVEDNYEHYSALYKFMPHVYRNDYSLTCALWTTNAHVIQDEDRLIGRLHHVDESVDVQQLDDTHYKLSTVVDGRQHWMNVRDVDFHMLDKHNFQTIVGGVR